MLEFVKSRLMKLLPVRQIVVEVPDLAAERLAEPQKMRRYEQAGKDVLVDFDGTLAEWDYPGYGEPTPGARHAMQVLKAMGMRIIIWSSRMDRRIYPFEERLYTAVEIKRWLRAHDIPFDEVDMGQAGKRLACAYIDDRGVHFDGDWGKALEQVDKLRRHNAQLQEQTRKVYDVDSGR